jgi:hypothetical protein
MNKRSSAFREHVHTEVQITEDPATCRSDDTANSRTARQEIPPPYVEPAGSLPLKQPATGTYPEPDKSNSKKKRS